MGYTMTPKAGGEAPDIEDGLYDADFEGVDLLRDKDGNPIEGQFGLSRRWEFTIYVDGEPEKVTGLTSTSDSTKSTSYAWLCAVVGRQPEVGEVIDMDALKGKARCRVMMKKNKRDWPTVIDVLPASKKGK